MLNKKSNTTNQAGSVESRVLGNQLQTCLQHPSAPRWPAWLESHSLPREQQSDCLRLGIRMRKMATVCCLQHPLRTLSSVLGQPATPAVVPAVHWGPETFVLFFQGTNVMPRWGKKCGEDEGLWGSRTPLKLAPPVPKNFVMLWC